MKKFIVLAMLSAFVFQLTDALQLKQYKKFQDEKKDLFEKRFDSSTDLIRGLITLRDGTLREHRHFGNIRFGFKDFEACSRDDSSDDAMTELLILTHPSTGGSGFNATGNGSISEDFKDSKHVLQIIAKMFRLANETRNREMNNTTADDDIGIIIKKAKNENINRDDYEAAVLRYFEFASLTSVYNKDLHARRKSIEILKNKIENTSEEDIGSLLGEIKSLKTLYGTAKKVEDFKGKLGDSVKYLADCVSSLINSDELSSFIFCLDRIKDLKKKEDILKNLSQTLLVPKRQTKEAKKIYKLFALAKVVAGAVLLERLKEKEEDIPTDEEKWVNHPYYAGYANDIICAYACGVISGSTALEDLETLARMMPEHTGDPYPSELTDIVSSNDDLFPSFIPFEVGQTPVTNGSGVQKDSKSRGFADCVETMMRQLFSLVFCSGSGELELNRIPDNPTEDPDKDLVKFFKGNDIREMANSGSLQVRNAWAKICSGHENIIYNNKDEQCELKSGWVNAIKLFCLLMKKYTGKSDVKNLITEVNSGVKKIEDESDVIDALNTLLAIRDDVRFMATSHGLRKDGNEVYGCITIQPEDPSQQINNAVDFNANGGHSYVGKIKGIPIRRIKNIKQIDDFISKLFSDDENSRIEFYKSYLDESKKERGWVGFVESLVRLSKFAGTTLKERSCNGIIAALQDIFNKKINNNFKIVEQSLKQKGEEVFGTIKLKTSGKELVISFDEDNKSTRPPELRYVNDLYFKKGLIFTNENSSLNESSYPVLDFYTRGNRKIQLEKTAISMLGNKLAKPYLHGIYRFNWGLTWNDPHSSFLHFVFKEAKEKELYKDYVSLCINNADILKLNYTVCCLSREGELSEGFRKEATDRLKDLLSDDENMPALDRYYCDWSDFASFLQPNSSILETVANYADRVHKKLEKNTKQRSYSIGLIGSIINAIKKEDLCALPDTDKSFMKLKEVIQKFSKEEEDGRFCSLNKNVASSKKHLELLLPICYVNDKEIADQVINQLGDNVDDSIIPISWAISEEKLDKYLNQIKDEEFFDKKCRALLRTCYLKDERQKKILKFVLDNFSDILKVLGSLEEGKRYFFSRDSIEEILTKTKDRGEDVEKICRWLVKYNEERKDAIAAWVVKNDQSNLIDSLTGELAEYFPEETIERILNRAKQNGSNIEEICRKIACNCGQNERNIRVIINWIEENKPNLALSLLDVLAREFSKETIKRILDEAKQNDSNIEEICRKIANNRFNCWKNTGVAANWIEENKPNLALSLVDVLAKHFSKETIKKILDEAGQNGSNIEEICRKIVVDCRNGKEDNIKAVAEWTAGNRQDLSVLFIENLAEYFPKEAVKEILEKAKQNGIDLERICRKIINNEENRKVVADWIVESAPNLVDLLADDLITCFPEEIIKGILEKAKQNGADFDTICRRALYRGHKNEEIIKVIAEWIEKNCLVEKIPVSIIGYLSDDALHSFLENFDKNKCCSLEEFILEANEIVDDGKLEKFNHIANWMLTNRKIYKTYRLEEMSVLKYLSELTKNIAKYASADVVLKLLEQTIADRQKFYENLRAYNMHYYYDFPEIGDIIRYSEQNEDKLNYLVSYLFDKHPDLLGTVYSIPVDALVYQLNQRKGQTINYDILGNLLVKFSHKDRSNVIEWMLRNLVIEDIVVVLDKIKGNSKADEIYSDFLSRSKRLNGVPKNKTVGNRESSNNEEATNSNTPQPSNAPNKHKRPKRRIRKEASKQANIHTQIADWILDNSEKISNWLAVRCSMHFNTPNLESKFGEKIDIEDFKNIDNIKHLFDVFGKVNASFLSDSIQNIFRIKGEAIPDEISAHISDCQRDVNSLEK